MLDHFIKIFLIKILFLSLIICHRIQKDFEMISYFGTIDTKTKSDTLKPLIIPKLYAQFDRDGNCNLTRSGIEGKNQFSSFRIKQAYLNEIMRFIRNVKDTIVTIRRNDVIYDGPAVNLFAYDHEGKSRTICFDVSHRSDLRFVRLYNYIDSASKIASFNVNFDTLKLLNEKEKLVSQIFEKVKLRFPIILNVDVPEEPKHNP